MHKKTITIITNPISGGKHDKKALAEFIAAEAEKRHLNSVIKYTSGKGDATHFAGAAANAKHDMVVVLGGDGTINEAATSLVNTDVALGIIPLGSGNGLARTIGIPMESKAACSLLFEGNRVWMDVGVANDRFFFLVAGVGFDAHIGKCFDEFQTRGPLSYFYLSAREFFTYRPDNLDISFADQKINASPFAIAIANGRQYGNNAIIAPKAMLNDGVLNISIIHRLSLWHAVSQLYKMFLGKIEDFTHAEFHEATELCIKRSQSGVVNIDGEACEFNATLNISVKPKALKIAVPKNTPCFN